MQRPIGTVNSDGLKRAITLRIMNRRKPLIALMAHPVKLGTWLNVWQGWIAGMCIAIQSELLVSFTPTLLDTYLLLSRVLS